MEVTIGKREFKYNGVALQDPGPQFSLEQCREFFAHLYPEIINAAIEGPQSVGNKVVYEFRRAVGTKGAARHDVLARVEVVLERNRGRAAEAMAVPKALHRLHAAVGELAEFDSHRHGMRQDLQAPALPDSHLLPLLP